MIHKLYRAYFITSLIKRRDHSYFDRIIRRVTNPSTVKIYKSNYKMIKKMLIIKE